MLPTVFVIICLLLPRYVQSSCCHLPFTDGDCQVNRNSSHRYQVMPDGRSGIVTASTECYINDFDANYRKVVQSKNYCNDCPGLLIFHTKSSEIFLFPEYLEHILEGRDPVQRKNVIILTTSLVGAYDLDFTYFSRYYASRPIEEVPSLYVDLQLPAFDPEKSTQPTLRLRLPTYDEDKEGLAKISRQDLIDRLNSNEQPAVNVHRLPYIYHFDIEKHRHLPSSCTLYDVQVASSSLNWKVLDSTVATCHTSMPFFGRNKCLAAGFTRLFCPLEENISTNDQLQLSPYIQSTNDVEHLTLAVVDSSQLEIVLSNAQLYPAKQVKILLLRGHLIVTDINVDLNIRVEYGWNCADFSLVVPAGFSATRYRPFDGENLAIYEGNSVVTLPHCFRVVPNSAPVLSPIVASPIFTDPAPSESNDEVDEASNSAESKLPIEFSLTNSTTDGDDLNILSNYWTILRDKNYLIYLGVGLLLLITLIPLCLGVYYRVYCNEDRKAKWTVEHGAHTNKAYTISRDDQTDTLVRAYVNNETQTTDTPIRI